MSRQTLERLKSAAIVLLLLSAILLGRQTGLFDQLLQLHGRAAAEAEPESTTETPQAASVPFAAVATGEGGMHYGVKEDEAAVGELYAKVSNILGEALGSAGAAVVVRLSEWRNALSGPGVYLDYLYPIPIAALSKWLGMDMQYDNGELVRRVCMTEGENGGVRLYYMTGDGIVLRCETAAIFSSLRARVDEYLPNGALFAFETGAEGAGLDPYTLLYTGTPRNTVIQATNPVGTAIDAGQILEALGISPYSNESYTESDGTVVFVDRLGYLTLEPGGTMRFRAYSGQGVLSELGTGEPVMAIEAVRRLLVSLCGESDGLERLYCTGITELDGDYVVTFSYFVHGLEVRLGRPAVRAVVSDAGIQELQVTLRRYYDASGVGVTLLPERQAAAIAQAETGEPELRLIYAPLGGDLLAPTWIMVE